MTLVLSSLLWIKCVIKLCAASIRNTRSSGPLRHIGGRSGAAPKMRLFSNAQLCPKNDFVKLKTSRECTFDENFDIFQEFKNLQFFRNLVENFGLRFPNVCEGIWTRKPYGEDCFDIIEIYRYKFCTKLSHEIEKSWKTCFFKEILIHIGDSLRFLPLGRQGRVLRTIY